MLREDAHLTQLFADLITTLDLGEIAVQALMGQVCRNVFEIPAGTGFFNCGQTDVGSEDLHRPGTADFGHIFLQRDGDGKRLFARGATGHPHADGFVRRPALYDAREYHRLQTVENFRIAEKCGNADQQIALQRRQFRRIALQLRAVIRHAANVRERQTAQYAAFHHLFAIQGKIDAGGAMQNRQDEPELLLVVAGRHVFRRRQAIRNERVVPDSDQFDADFFRRQHEIDAARRHRRLRHGAKLRARGILRKRHASRGFDGFHSRRTI